MIKSIGIRREDRSIWERRVPVVPQDIEKLSKEGITFKIQPSQIRCYSNEEFENIGVSVTEKVSDCDFLIGVKEMPIPFIQPEKPHLFFSHTIKGQSYNMDLLKTFLERKATLLDYERIVDDNNVRLIAFGRFAGLAGIIDSLSILGKKWKSMGITNPFEKIKFSHEYKNLSQAKEEITQVGKELKEWNIDQVGSFVVGVPGTGNVSIGIQEILELLPLKKITAKELPLEKEKLAYCVLDVGDWVHSEEGNYSFEDYCNHPHKYKSHFHTFLPYLTLIANSVYWDERFPRIVTKKDLLELWNKDKNPKLQVIGDISCDVEGSIECTVKTTDPSNPMYIYDPIKGEIRSNIDENGVAILAVDILPAEFSLDASNFFSHILFDIIKQISQADFSADFENSNLPNSLKKATIVWKGKLTKEYEYLVKFIK